MKMIRRGIQHPGRKRKRRQGAYHLRHAACFLRIESGITWQATLVGKGAEVPKLVENGKSKFGRIEIAGKTLGVTGLGRIRRKSRNAAVALDMRYI